MGGGILLLAVIGGIAYYAHTRGGGGNGGNGDFDGSLPGSRTTSTSGLDVEAGDPAPKHRYAHDHAAPAAVYYGQLTPTNMGLTYAANTPCSTPVNVVHFSP